MKRDGRCAAHTPSSASVGCRRQTSVTAGTILHASKLPLTVWFWAAYLMATAPTASLPCAPETARYRPLARPPRNRRGQPSIPDLQISHDGKHRPPSNSETSQAACGWPKSPPTAPPTSPSSKPTIAVRRHRENRRLGPRGRRSPLAVGKTAAHLVRRGSTKLLQPQRMGARRRAASQASEQAYLRSSAARSAATNIAHRANRGRRDAGRDRGEMSGQGPRGREPLAFVRSSPEGHIAPAVRYERGETWGARSSSPVQ